MTTTDSPAQLYQSVHCSPSGDDERRFLVAHAIGDVDQRIYVIDGVFRETAIAGEAVRAMSLVNRHKTTEQNLRASLKDLDKRIADIDAGLTTTFPQYAALTSNQPASLAAIQTLLGPDEAMVSYLSGSKQPIVFALRHDQVEAKVIKLERMNRKVLSVSCGAAWT